MFESSRDDTAWAEHVPNRLIKLGPVFIPRIADSYGTVPKNTTFQVIGICMLFMPTLALASDMTILMFVFSFPACLVLVAMAFIIAAFIKPGASVLLALPIVPLIGIHLYMLPHMYHGDEIAAFIFQAVLSSTSLFSFRIVKRRAERASSMNSSVSEEADG